MNQPIEKSYIVCSTMRSGSTLLCRTLKSINIAGDPKEYFNPDWNKVGIQTNEPDELYQHCSRVMQETTTSNGVFGLKMHWNHMMTFLRICRKDPAFSGKNALGIIESIFPNSQDTKKWREGRNGGWTGW